ncbi:MAG TPA: N-acetylmuramoyl-L-alanine amidase, partial [Bacteroidales bacterium]|nr:N-acetylmuramoyl-L-alanine amidase [Bacteroidales bacterium]
MKQINITLVAIAALFISNALSAQVPLKIVIGGQDTVYNQKHTIVCITDPGNVAAINENQLKVYRTGAFGTELDLKRGNNKIEITLFKGKNRRIETLNVYYDPDAKKPVRPEPKMTLEEAKAILEKSKYKEELFYATSLEGAYLQFGDGDDRLGGSKMGYVDQEILFKVVASVGDLYKVQLSQNKFAYIPREYLERSEERTSQVNTGSWSVSNLGKADRVSISLPKRLPYVSWTQLDPTTICIDLYGATNNSNWITQYRGLQMISYVDYRQVDSDVFRVILRLKHKYSWGYKIGYEGNNLIIDVRHTPELSLKGLRVGLDAGHGGTALGAVSITGIREKDVNLDIVNMLKGALEAKGATVVLSRSGDYDISMSERKRIFNENNVHIALSIHNNAGGSPVNPMGSSTYYKHITNRDFAETMLERLLELGVPNFGLVGNFNFSLAAPTEYPVVLLELLFMSSIWDEERLVDPDFRKKMVNNIVLGLEDYLEKVDSSIEEP